MQVDTESLAERLCLQNVLDLLKNKKLHVVYFQAEAALPAALETASKAQEEASKAQEEAVKAMQKAETAEKNAARALQLAQGKRFVRFKCYVFLRCPSFLLQCQDCALGQGTKPAKTAPLPTLSKPLASDAFGLAFACCFMVHGALVSKHALECKAASKADRSCSFQTNSRFPPKSMRWKNDWRWQTNALHIICCTWALDGIVAF